MSLRRRRRCAAFLLIPGLVAAFGACTSDGGDQTLPQVSLVRPLDGITVSGEVLMEATASDAGGLLRVIFVVDSDELGEDDTQPYTYVWDSAPYGDGDTHTLLAVAEDRAGNLAYSEYVVVRVMAP